MTVPSIEALTKKLEDDQAAMLPGQKSGDKLTLHYLANLTVAKLAKDCYQELEDRIAAIDILRATGENLNKLVAPVLIGGRLPGNHSAGIVYFKTSYPTSADITIPVGTRVYAILEDATKVYFQTTAEGVIPAGQTQVAVAARAAERGLQGNIGPHQIVQQVKRIAGITSVENPLEFAGGTEDETDDELRQRYFDKIRAPGKATATMLERSLMDLSTVTEAKIINHGSGDVSVLVDYSGGVTSPSEEIVDCLRTNLAGGAVARGTLGATVDGQAVAILEDDVYGGLVWVRPRNHITVQDGFTFTYTNMEQATRTGTVTIPAGTHRGVMIQASLEAPTDRVKRILSVTPSQVGNSYDVLMGMGEANMLYNLPELINVSIAAKIRLTETPEQGLVGNVRASWNAFLSHFKMGENLQLSDVIKFMYNMYDPTADDNVGRPINGIDELVEIMVSGGGQGAYRIGDKIVVEEDWRLITQDNISIVVVS